ncbi:cytochrome b5 domain-containing protein [Clostridium vincentii]|uniref:Cytochrome b5-like Heme/Steroid binding domain protein n=1 Tax=Clostridium vincentii TaxID=52704 RepID=A0A2T0BFL1_9CLOT|nr:cytochrome b5 domain-containing protein [Clostridium vincentii]PRR82648.1 Cytochrome b5-like Heme/Steroid binding domain protein [Clostridium vincentii]
MSIYFDLKTIRELIGDNYYREQKEFTLEELSQYDGSNGKPAYVAIEGIVYDLSKESTWAGGTHFNLTAGKDLTVQFKSCHGMSQITNNLLKVGYLQ